MTERSVNNMAAKKIIKSEKREQILLAAISVFTKNGINNSTIRDIALSADVGKGTIYEYFKNKNEIISQAYRYFMSMFDTGIEDIVLKSSSGKDKLKMITDFIIGFIDNDKNDMMNLIFDFWAESIRTKTSKNIIYMEMRHFYGSYRSLVRDLILEGKEDGSFRDDIDHDSLASLFVGMLDGIMVQWVIDREQINLSLIRLELIRLIEKGIGK